ncbi:MULTISPECIES: c-type cytochrome [Sphingobacterium]|uniref:Thiosulfate dehydrogenase n=1 Tax=Sphingobacterium siyangense TaxID=459529 RepID=A0A562MNF8_9SPHI|nr:MULTISPECIES: c-type cytochrome [Sphingobacterium]APU95877.1 cytochrome C [Sphingobacterium sp. B29]TWI21081.1 thiosulfate dehydrogenase [Sphingobacterium siyangense]UQA76230.1 c-type cytochrome [Sphingobacterium siyangense]HAL52193.1 cytochrome C [Sphingobacterium sp.]
MEYKKLTDYLKALSWIIVALVITCTTLCVFPLKHEENKKQTDSLEMRNDSLITHVSQFKEISFKDNPEGKMASYGEKLIKNTYDYFYDGEVKIGNKLACSSCHLNGGTKAFAAPYVGLTNVFPTYIGRENKVESLEERINGCFERSMNGRAIPENSKEMRAIITYIKNISINTVNKGRLAGQGFIKMDIPNRAADLKHGQLVFENKCTSCHGKDGQGLPQTAGKGYQYPPLWGKDSYNDGAGMARLLTAARFIKANMPLGATYDAPQLKDDEAYDVAAYINSFDRPQKTNKQLDYPNLSKKPKDSPYPPYADNVSTEQHKLGPFNF